MRQGFTLFCIFLSLFSQNALGQNKSVLQGTVQDSLNRPLNNVRIEVSSINFNGYASTNSNGFYQLNVPSDQFLTIEFGGKLNYERIFKSTMVASGETKTLNIVLELSEEKSVVIKGRYLNLNKIKAPTPGRIATPTDNFEDLIKLSALGVSSTNELSSTYNVRGGNYDENLIYVNDIEIFRPFLTRSGQQEGLSFIHSDLVDDIQFSAGGFDAKYGDKMSSVLDIRYRTPHQTKGSFRASFMGGTAHMEGVTAKNRLTYLVGARYRNNSYVLGSLQTKGDYKPVFADAQSLLTYRWTENLTVDILGHFSSNKFRVIPENRETAFGPINEALKFTVYFDGQEVSTFQTATGAASFNYITDKTEIKWISSIFNSTETEKFDIQGQYFLDELETDLGSEEFGQTTVNRGVGTFLNHARNRLDANIYNTYIKANTKFGDRHRLFYGAKLQHERFDDVISEWQLLDSADYSLPHSSSGDLELFELLKARLSLRSNRYSAYVQDAFSTSRGKDTTINDSTFTSYSVFKFTGGVRSQYWQYNDQLLVSPRVKLSYTPRLYYTRGDSIIRRDAEIRFASGVYYQPPFYRELRTFNGTLNPEVLAQRSIHFVIGGHYTFDWWNRPFKVTSEIYFKMLDFINPYEVNNVRIQYHAENKAKGYAAGADFKINGEFIEGIESWAKLSFLKTEEDISNDYYYDYFNSDGEEIIFGFTANDSIADSTLTLPGYIARPADQRVTVGLFFQDEMPKWPSYKVQLSLIFGTGIPYGPPDHDRYKDIFRSTAYKRVDIGFSKDLLTNKERLKPNSIWRKVDDMWISLEVFNLLNIENTVSYTWIKDANNLSYPVPNQLTLRRVNLKFVCKF